MSDADTPTCISKLEEAVGDCLRAWPALAGNNVLTDQSKDLVAPAEAGDSITIYTVGWDIDDDTVQGQQVHTAALAFEYVSRTQAIGTISRANQVAIANTVAALGASDDLGGMVQAIEPDTVSAEANGRDAAAASLHIKFTFFTPLNDWFHIAGIRDEIF